MIAYEIHDGLAQQLAAAHDAVPDPRPPQGQQDTEEAKKAYDAAWTMVRQGHFEARRLISGVRPPVLDESGVEAAIAHLVHEQREPSGPKIEFHSEVQFGRLPRSWRTPSTASPRKP